MVDETPRDARLTRLELTVPCDARFRSLLEVMSEKMAGYVGYPRLDACAVAEAVARAAGAAFSGREQRTYSSVVVTFATSAREMEIQVRYHGDDQADRTDLPGIERVLARRGRGAAPLDAMRRVVRRVEFGRDRGVECCRLIKPLPGESR